MFKYINSLACVYCISAEWSSNPPKGVLIVRHTKPAVDCIASSFLVETLNGDQRASISQQHLWHLRQDNSLRNKAASYLDFVLTCPTEPLLCSVGSSVTSHICKYHCSIRFHHKRSISATIYAHKRAQTHLFHFWKVFHRFHLWVILDRSSSGDFPQYAGSDFTTSQCCCMWGVSDQLSPCHSAYFHRHSSQS